MRVLCECGCGEVVLVDAFKQGHQTISHYIYMLAMKQVSFNQRFLLDSTDYSKDQIHNAVAILLRHGKLVRVRHGVYAARTKTSLTRISQGGKSDV